MKYCLQKTRKLTKVSRAVPSSLWDHGEFSFCPMLLLWLFYKCFPSTKNLEVKGPISVLPTFFFFIIVCGPPVDATVWPLSKCRVGNILQGWPSGWVRDPSPSNPVMAGGVTGGKPGGREGDWTLKTTRLAGQLPCRGCSGLSFPICKWVQVCEPQWVPVWTQ